MEQAPAKSRHARPRLAGAVAGGVLLAYLLFHVVRVWRSLGGWGYSIDDAYIHLALARTLRESGVWGLTPFDAAGASSSPLWTLVLAAFRAPLFLPLVLNVALAVGATAWLAAECARRSGSAAIGALLALFAATYALAVYAVSSGMEHILHGVLVVLFLKACLGRGGGWKAAAVAAWGALALACRLETVLVLPIGLSIALFRRDALRSVAVILGGALGSMVYAAVAAWQGFSLVPNSVAIKILETPRRGLLGRLWNNFDNQRGLLLLAAVMVAAAAAVAADALQRRGWRGANLEAFVASAVVAAFLLVAKVSYLARYEVFAVMTAAALGLPALAGALRTVQEPASAPPTLAWGRVAAAAVGGVALLFGRAATPRLVASGELYALQWSRETDASQREIARFINASLPRGTFLLNDVGAPSYFTRARIVDLWGLGNNAARDERLRTGGLPSTAWLESYARDQNADAAIVFADWFDGTTFPRWRSPDVGLPKSWRKVGEFRFVGTDPMILGAPVIGIYAIRPEDAPALRAKVAAYVPTSPLNRVTVIE